MTVQPKEASPAPPLDHAAATDRQARESRSPPPDCDDRAFWFAVWRALVSLADAVLKHKLGGVPHKVSPPSLTKR